MLNLIPYIELISYQCRSQLIMQDDVNRTVSAHEGSLKLVPAVMRAAQILDWIAQAEGGLKLSDLVRQTGLPKSSLHGLCQTLLHLKLLQLTPGSNFIMGPQSVRWANAFLADNDIVDAFHDVVAQAAELDAYTLTLSHLEGPDVIY